MAKIKGISLIEVVKALRGRADEAHEFLPESLHHYLSERISVSQWYPEEDHIGLLRACAAMVTADGPDAKDVYEQFGAVHARNHAEGIYEHLLQDLSSSSPAVRIAALWSSMHDTGRVEVDNVGPGEVLVRISDYGQPTEEMCAMVGAYFREAYRLSGARSVHVVKTACCVFGGEACAWQIRWDERSTD